MLSHCCKAGYHVCTPQNPNVRNRQHVCLFPGPHSVLSGDGGARGHFVLSWDRPSAGNGRIFLARTPLAIVSAFGQSGPVVSAFGQRNPEISRKSLAESAQNGRRLAESAHNARRTQPTNCSVPRPGTETHPPRGHFGLSHPRPHRRQSVLSHPRPPPDATLASPAPVPREDIRRGQARKTEYANDPVLSICKGGVDIVL